MDQSKGGIMSIDELLMRLGIANGCKDRGKAYYVSPETYKKMEKAGDHYLKTGDLVRSGDRLVRK